MRQNIIFSTLAVAVAPAAAMAAPGTYMSEKGVVQTVTGNDEAKTVFESSTVQLPDNNDEQRGLRAFYLTYDKAGSSLPVGTKVRILYGDKLLSERDPNANPDSYKWPVTTPSYADFDNFPKSDATLKLQLVVPTGQTATITGIYLTTNLADNGKNYVKDELLDGFYTKVKKYATSINSKNYVLSNDDNADLLLMQDLAIEGDEEKTVENYEKFDIFNGTETIEKAFSELQARIEKNEANRLIEEANEGISEVDKDAQQAIIDDPNASQDSRDLAQDILNNVDNLEQKGKEIADAEKEMTEYDPEKAAEIQNAVKDYANLAAYIDWQSEAQKVQAAIDRYDALLNGLAATDGQPITFDETTGDYQESGAGLGDYQIMAFRESVTRLGGQKLVLKEFLAKAKKSYEATTDEEGKVVGEFTAPKDVETTNYLKDPATGVDITNTKDPIYANEPYKGKFGKTYNFANIAALLGTEQEAGLDANKEPKFRTDHSVLGNIAYVEGCAKLYQDKTAEVFGKVQDANKDYDEQMTLLEAKFQEFKDNETYPVDFTEAMNTVRDLIFANVQKGGAKPGINSIKEEVTKAKKDGDPISYVTNHGPRGFGKIILDWSTAKDEDYVPWQLWEHQLEELVGTDGDINKWIEKVQNAYDTYTNLKNLTIGENAEGSTPKSLLVQLNEAFPEADREKLDATVQGRIKDIIKYINTLSGKLDEAVNTIDVAVNAPTNAADLGDNLSINGADFDLTQTTSKWNKVVDYKTVKLEKGDYFSHGTIEKMITDLSQINTYLAKLDGVDGLATKLKTYSEVLNAMTPATSEDPDATVYTDPAYTATHFYGYISIDDQTTGDKDEAKDNTGWAMKITDWIEAARAKVLKTGLDPQEDSFAQDDEKFSDDNGGFITYAHILADVDALTTGGNGGDGVAHYKAILDDIKKDEARIAEIESKVKDHGIYEAENYDYQATIAEWRDKIAQWKDTHKFYPLDTYTKRDEEHWQELKALEYNSETGDKYLVDLATYDNNKIDADKAAYEFEELKKSVKDLYTYLYGTNGYDDDDPETGKPGYVDTTIKLYENIKEFYKGLIGENEEGDVFGTPEHSADRGNASTLRSIFSETEGILKGIKETTGSEKNYDQSTAIQAYLDLRDASTQADWEAAYDKLLKVRDVLDVYYKTLEEGEMKNNVTATEGKPDASLTKQDPMTTNLELLRTLVDDLAKNKAAYDGLIKIKGMLTTRVEDILEELDAMEQTPQGDALKQLIIEQYKPVPAREVKKIEDLYKNCKAYSEGPNSTRKPDVEVEGTGLKVEDPNQLEYWVLKDSLDHLNKLMTNFTNGFPVMIAGNNDNAFANTVVPAFNDAMGAFDQAVIILNKFKTPEPPKQNDLLPAFNKEWEKATLAIYPAANKARAARAEALKKKDGKSLEAKNYDPTSDKDALIDIKDEIVTAINAFVEAMNAKANEVLMAEDGDRGAAVAAIGDADTKIQNGGDSYKFNQVPNPETGEMEDYVYNQNKYFKAEKDIIAKADDLANMKPYPGNNWSDDQYGIHKGDFEQFLQFDKFIQDEKEGLQSIPASVKTKLNQAAYEDLGNRISEFVAANVTPLDNKFKEKPIEGYPEKISQEKFDELVETGTIEEGKTPQDYGYGKKAADGNYYTYKFALGEDYEAEKAKYDELKKSTVGAAKELAENYYNEEKLPTFQDKDEEDNDIEVNSRQEVLDLLKLFAEADPEDEDAIDMGDIDAELDAAYQEKVIDNQQYLADKADFEDRLAEEKAGIESLYVGPKYAPDLDTLEKEIEKSGSSADIDDLNKQLDEIVVAAKKAEGKALLDEATKLKDDYNQMVKEADEAGETDRRNELVKKYTTDDEDESGVEPTDDQKQLDIDSKISTLGVYNTNIGDASYEDYLTLESDLSKIKEEIAIDRGKMTADQIAAIAPNLLARLEALYGYESEYIEGQKLLYPENPQEEGFLGEHFGLNKYYLNEKFADPIKKRIDKKILELDALKQNIKDHEANIMLYKDMFESQLKANEEFAKKADLACNSNDADDEVESFFEKNEKEKEYAQGHAANLERLQEEINAAWETLNEAKTIVDGYALTTPVLDEDGNPVLDEDGNAVEEPRGIAYDDYAKALNLLQVRLNTYYLKRDVEQGDNPFDENVNLTDNKGKAKYELYLFKEKKEQITEEWLAQFAAGEGESAVSLAQYYNAENGIVTLPACKGLDDILESIADQVEDFTEMAAAEEWAKAQAAYNEAEKTIDDTEMRYTDKMGLYYRLYGAHYEEKDETVYETDDLGNLVLDENDDPIVKTPDTSYQKQLNDLLEAIEEQTPETMEQYKTAIQNFINALGELNTEAKASRAGDIAGGGEDGMQPDGVVDVFDLQLLLNLVSQPNEKLKLKEENPKKFNACDLNNDGDISITDLTVMSDILIGETAYLYEEDYYTGEPIFAARQLGQTNETLRADVVATEGNSQRIAISLSNERDYTAFQMDVTLPEGMRLVGQSLSDRADGHQLYANEWDGKVRLVGFTSTKNAFTGNDGAVLYLDVETDESYKGGSVKYEDIIFATTKSQGVKFKMQGETTGVISRFAEAAKETIYNLGGRVMDGLKKGVNILRGDDGAKKVIKK